MSTLENVGVVLWSGYPDDKFLWTLPNSFGSFYDGDNYGKVIRSCVVCSPLFVSFDIKWRLAFIRNDNSRNNTGYYGLFLWKISPSNHFSNLTVQLGIEKANCKTSIIAGELTSNGWFGKWDYIPHNTFHFSQIQYSVGGIIRVFCEIRRKTEKILDAPLKKENLEQKKKIKEDDIVKEVPESKGVDKLIEDFKNLLLNGLNSDVMLKVQEREFKVHRNILMTRSPVFASMLQHDTKENATGIVDIPDCSAEAFEVFLSYVYTGKAVAMSSDNVFDLYYAADKYQINDLKFECVEYMDEKLSIQNFCPTMTLSET